jgi:hypothetical protein
VPFFSRCKLREADAMATFILRVKSKGERSFSATLRRVAARRAPVQRRAAHVAHELHGLQPGVNVEPAGRHRSTRQCFRTAARRRIVARQQVNALAHVRRLGGVADAALRATREQA